MTNSNKCPSPQQIQAWLDCELKQPLLQSHISTCPTCLEHVSLMEKENKLLCDLLDNLPQIDITHLIMPRLLKERAEHLQPSLIYLLISCLGISLSVMHYFVSSYLANSYLPLLLLRVLSFVDKLSFIFNSFLNFLLQHLKPEENLLPALLIILSVIFFNIMQTRRSSHV